MAYSTFLSAFALKALVLQLLFNHAYSVREFQLPAGCDGHNCPGKCVGRPFGSRVRNTCQCPPGHFAWGLGCFKHYFRTTGNCHDSCPTRDCDGMDCICEEGSFAQGQQCVKKKFSLRTPCTVGESCGVYGSCTGGSTCSCIGGFVVKPEYPDRCIPGAGLPYDHRKCRPDGKCSCGKDTVFLSAWGDGTGMRCYCMYGKTGEDKCRILSRADHH
ncbi:hypothetical protein BaRGS_00023019 [Batillaria attramentaria]|uniref:Uncharacterized protein n=1 Tax=Batillaria attramentaria TaxID=370345 RepID=A0ABD0KFD1_9CAEN